MFGEDENGERIGYLRATGVGPEQLAARPQYAVSRQDSGFVLESRLLEHHAQWAAEPYLDAMHERVMDLRTNTLPRLEDRRNQGRDVVERSSDEPVIGRFAPIGRSSWSAELQFPKRLTIARADDGRNERVEPSAGVAAVERGIDDGREPDLEP